MKNSRRAENSVALSLFRELAQESTVPKDRIDREALSALRSRMAEAVEEAPKAGWVETLFGWPLSGARA